ncbi:hypothetical protein [Rhodomicrobium lacus]|uniref:hypothetical protein n=1 Tax=Rhodomicrobium lacus TaxID=2498452 RepID=UPI000F8F4808|nr:hypothetical protein [Rhodomicrobium lacus]
MMVDQGADLIVDAMRAANPQRVRESTERLRLLAETTGSVPSMEEMLSAPQAQAARGLAGQGAASLAAFHPATSGQAATGKSPYELFEISVLSTLFEIMLPKSASAFGAGFSGNVWKSMMSQSLADACGRAGALGIANRLEERSKNGGARAARSV